MELDWITLLIGLGLAILAWKVIKGVIKFAAIAAIMGGAYYAYSQGVLS